MKGANRFSIVDLNHCFHQFELDNESKELFVFNTENRVYQFNTLVMGVSSASSECHERMRKIVKGLYGVQQIKDDIVIHGVNQQHTVNVEKLLERLEEHIVTLRRSKCLFGVQDLKWFRNTYSKKGMSADPAKVDKIKAWSQPTDKTGVKSSLQTIKFCQVFMRPGGGRMHSYMTKMLSNLMVMNFFNSNGPRNVREASMS